jgi:hypothetical protein
MRCLRTTHGHADFFVLVSDNLYVSQRNKAEFVEFSKAVPFLRSDQCDEDETTANVILIPDFFIQDDEYSRELIAIENASNAVAFEQRLNVIKWRGSLHGPDYPNLENCRDFPRYELLMTSLKHPAILDARLITYNNVSGNTSADTLRRQLQDIFGNPAEELPAEAFVRYKYLVSVDGVASAWKRVPTILASRSVLLLQHRWNQYFYPGLTPWVHYVPLKDDISDLVERYEWLLTHQLDAKRIADNGKEFAKEILQPTALERYFAEIINQCGELYTD